MLKKKTQFVGDVCGGTTNLLLLLTARACVCVSHLFTVGVNRIPAALQLTAP